MGEDNFVLVRQLVKTMQTLFRAVIAVNGDDIQIVPVNSPLPFLPFRDSFFKGLIVVETDLYVSKHTAGVVEAAVLIGRDRLLHIPAEVLQKFYIVVHVKTQVDGGRQETKLHVVVYVLPVTVGGNNRSIPIFQSQPLYFLVYAPFDSLEQVHLILRSGLSVWFFAPALLSQRLLRQKSPS